MKLLSAILCAASACLLPALPGAAAQTAAAAPTAPVAAAARGDELLITSENSRAALRVERRVLPVEKHADGTPAPRRYRYSVDYIDWEGGAREQRRFCSEHVYGQGYASGDVLVLTNSGMPGNTAIALAVLDRKRAHVLEDRLLLRIGYAVSSHWSGADEQGRPCGGSTSCRVWHRQRDSPGSLIGMDGWRGDSAGIALSLGVVTPNNPRRSGISWYYSTETGSTRLSGAFRHEMGKPLAHVIGLCDYEGSGAPPASADRAHNELRLDVTEPPLAGPPPAAPLDGTFNVRDSAPAPVQPATAEQQAALREALRYFLYCEELPAAAETPATEAVPTRSADRWDDLGETLLAELAATEQWYVAAREEESALPRLRIICAEGRTAFMFGGGQEFYFIRGNKIYGLGSLLCKYLYAEKESR